MKGNTMLYVGAAAIIAFLLYKKKTADVKPIPTPKEPKPKGKPQQPAQDVLLNFSTTRDYSSAAPITPTTTTTTPTTTTTTPTTTTTTTTPKKAVIFNPRKFISVPKFSPTTNIAGLFNRNKAGSTTTTTTTITKRTINGHEPICNY